MFFDWISIVFLAILIIAFVIGLYKGFVASIGWTFGVAIAIVAAFFLAKPLAASLTEAGAFDSINAQILTFVKDTLRENDLEPAINLAVPVSAFANNMEPIPTILSALHIPSILQPQVLNFIVSVIPSSGSVVVSDAVAEGITVALATVISFIAVFAAVFVLFLIVKIVVWFIRRAGRKRPSMLSRIAGGLIQVANGFLFIYIVSFVLALLASTVPAIGTELTNILHLGTDDWSFAKWLVENNAIFDWISQYLSL